LRAIIGAPPPFRINRPQRDVRKYYDGLAVLHRPEVVLKPLQLLLAKRPQASRFKVHNIDQADEMDTVLVETMPAAPLSIFDIAFAKHGAVVVKNIMLSGDEKDFLSRALEDL